MFTDLYGPLGIWCAAAENLVAFLGTARVLLNTVVVYMCVSVFLHVLMSVCIYMSVYLRAYISSF